MPRTFEDLERPGQLLDTALIELSVDPGPTVAYAASSISDFSGSGSAATAVPPMPSDISVRVTVRVRFAFSPR